MRRKIGVLTVLVGVLCFRSAVVGGPQVLEVSPTTLDFSAYTGEANPAAQVVSIWNSGHGPMDWTVTEDCNWITVEPNSGSSLGEADDVNVIVDINGLSGGVYNCQLTVGAGAAANSPQIVDVNLSVIGAVFVVPLPGCLGSYTAGERKAFTIDLGVELQQINVVRFICAGTVTAGLSYYATPIPAKFCASFDTDPEFMWAIGPKVGASTYPLPEYFSDNPRFEPMGGATWDFLLDGQADGWVVLSSIVYVPEQPPISFPTGYLEAASIRINAVPLLAGDFDGSGVVDLVDFAVLGLAWGTADGEPGYNVDCDISEPGDGAIDSLDLAVFCENWLAGL